jgi:Acetyltransferases, including N-acetylases of ribosomal proteins
MFETERIRLRRWTLEDAGDMYAYATNPNVGPNAGWNVHESIEESKKVIQMFLQGDEWAIVDKVTNRVIGSVGIMKDFRRRYEGSYFIGYVLAEEYWGKGIMTEAVKTMIPYVFETLHASILSVGHFTRNNRSRRVIEKCGFVYEGTYRRGYFAQTGDIHDDANYSMLDTEYKKLKEEGFFLVKM